MKRTGWRVRSRVAVSFVLAFSLIGQGVPTQALAEIATPDGQTMEAMMQGEAPQHDLMVAEDGAPEPDDVTTDDAAVEGESSEVDDSGRPVQQGDNKSVEDVPVIEGGTGSSGDGAGPADPAPADADSASPATADDNPSIPAPSDVMNDGPTDYVADSNAEAVSAESSETNMALGMSQTGDVTSPAIESADGAEPGDVGNPDSISENEEVLGEGFVEGEVLVLESDDTSEEQRQKLFDSYVTQMLEAELPGGTGVAVIQSLPLEHTEFTTAQRNLYDFLRPLVSKVARGERSSTEFETTATDIYGSGVLSWTAEDLGVTSIRDASGNLTSAAKNAFMSHAKEAISGDWYGRNVYYALVTDCPLDMYWTNGYLAYSYNYSWNSSRISVTSIRYRMYVAHEYRNNGNVLSFDTTKVSVTSTAIARAKQIVNENKNKLPLERLTAYKNAICRLTEYNSEAANSGNTYAEFESTLGTLNPWQLIWVFDGDSNTNVVCEGYAKAFQYLCDLDPIPGVNCYTVTGTLGSYHPEKNQWSVLGAHMWNIVHMPNGGNYLVDVTNCDEGESGYPDKLFLKTHRINDDGSESYDPKQRYCFNTYTVKVNGVPHYAQTTYNYDDRTLALFDNDALLLSSNGYSERVIPPEPRTNLTYNGSEQVGVPEGPGYTLSGTWKATNASGDWDYVAYATLDAGYDEWLDGSTDRTRTIYWRIGYKDVTLDIANATKTYGQRDPAWNVTVRGLIGNDKVQYTVNRSPGENVGKYSISTAGEGWQGNYHLVYSFAELTILPAKVSLPTAKKGLVYNGYKQTGVSAGTYYTVSGGSALNAGSYTATAHLTDKNHSWPDGTTTDKGIAWSIAKGPASITVSDATVTVGNRTALNARGTGGSLRYKSADTSIATVDYLGVVTGIKPGTTKVTVTSDETKNLAQVSKTITVRVNALPFASATVIAPSSQTYTGSALTPKPTVKMGSTTLREGADYALSYKNNVNVGTATVTVTGKGNYAGTKSASFAIIASDVSGATVDGIGQQTWTGGALTPKPTVKKGGRTLREGTDYTLSYANNVNVGTATVTVTGKGNYAGSKNASFTIAQPAPQPAPAPAPQPAPANNVPSWTRVFGQSALDTGKAVVEIGNAFPAGRGGTVIVATSDGYWDALAAAGLAGTLDAPVLITPKDHLCQQTAEEIARLAPSRALVMGGPLAVSDECLAQIAAMVPDTSRVWGQTAVDTAIEIWRAGGGWGSTAVVATSSGYWDALSAAPYAWWGKAPIFLTSADGRLTDATVAAIRSGGFTRVVVVGGPMVVSADVEGQLAGISAIRLFGQNAIDTSAEIARWELSEGMGASSMAVATGGGYWDALTGAAVCGRNASVLVLANEGQYQAFDAVYDRSKVINGYVLGGPLAVSDASWGYFVSR